MYQCIKGLTKELKTGKNQITWPTQQKVIKNTGIVLCWSGIVAGIVVFSDFVLHMGFQFLLHLFS